MSFSAEISDFVKGFQAGSQVGGDIMDRKFKKEQAELDRAFKQGEFDFEKEKFADNKAYRASRDADNKAYRERVFSDRVARGNRAERRAEAASRRADEALKLRAKQAEDSALAAYGTDPGAMAKGQSYADDYDFEADASVETDVDYPEVDTEEPEFKRGGLVPHANTGGAIPEEPPVEEPESNPDKGDLLVEKAKPILKEVFDDEAAKLSEKPEAIATKPKKDQSRISVISGEGAASPEEIKAIDKVIDPENRMEPYRKGAARLVTAYNFFVEKGDMEKARNVAKRIVGFHKLAAQTQGNLAMAALERGDLRAASKLVTDAYNENVFDGNTLEAAPTPRGTVMYKTNNKNFAQEQGEVGAQELWALAAKVADGSAFIDSMTDLAATAKSKGKGSYSKDVAEAARARNQLEALVAKRETVDDEKQLAEIEKQIAAQQETVMSTLEKARNAARLTKRPQEVFEKDYLRALKVEPDFAIPAAGGAAPEAPEEKSDGSWWNPSTFSEGINQAINSTIPGGGDWFGIQASKQAVPAQPAPAQPAPQQAAPARPRSKEEFNALPPGTLFIDPDGNVRRKP
jgi:hypothetical protein